MQTLGAPMILVCANASPGAVTDDARIAAQLYELADRAARRNLRVGYEALAWSRHVNHYEHAWSIVKAADHPHLGIVIDSFHILSLGDEPEGHRGDSRREDLLPADGGRAAPCDGRAPVEPALPLLSGPGPVRPGAFPGAGAGRRLHGTVFARDLQRRVPRGAEPAHGCRRDAVDPLLRGADPAADGARRRGTAPCRARRGCARSSGSSCSTRRRCRSFPASRSSSSPSTRRANGCSTTCSKRSGSGARDGTGRSTSRSTARARSTSS